MDDGEHMEPTKENIMNAYKKLVAEAKPGDACFCHYSGHGGKVRDDDGDESKFDRLSQGRFTVLLGNESDKTYYNSSSFCSNLSNVHRGWLRRNIVRVLYIKCTQFICKILKMSQLTLCPLFDIPIQGSFGLCFGWADP